MKAPIPSLGRSVHVLNAMANRTAPEAAVITRVWSSHTSEIGMVNITVFPDSEPPVCRASVPLFPSEQAAIEHLKELEGHRPIVAYWPSFQ